MDLSLSGLASGFDWKSVVNQLTQVDRVPQTRLRATQQSLLTRTDALSSLTTQLASLRSKASVLADASLFKAGRVSTSSDQAVATASADSTASTGSYDFKIYQLAAAASQKGASIISLGVDTSQAVTSSAAGFSIQVSAGNFSINGKTIAVGASDSLSTVLDNINSSGAGVTASYDSDTDKVTLTSASAIVLGTPTDTSNFLQAARLFANGTGAVTSNTKLGALHASDTLASARLKTAVAGSGQFQINGVGIDWSSSDTLASVLSRISQSNAGVNATYDSTTDRINLTNKQTGNLGISVADVTGNFLSATGVLDGSLVNGRDLLFTVNDSGMLNSRTNTITSESSGLEGLVVHAVKGADASGAPSSVTITVGSDTSRIRSAITEFVDEYNKTQAMIDVQTASSTDARGKVTAGILADERDVADIAQTLRRQIASDVEGLSGTIQRLASLGYKGSGYSNEISLADSGALDQALGSSLDQVKNLFSDSSGGIATKLGNYLNSVVGDNGSLVRHRDMYSSQSTRIDSQVIDMEKVVQASRQRLTASFVTMEKMLAQINQQASFFAQRFH